MDQENDYQMSIVSGLFFAGDNNISPIITSCLPFFLSALLLSLYLITLTPRHHLKSMCHHAGRGPLEEEREEEERTWEGEALPKMIKTKEKKKTEIKL